MKGIARLGALALVMGLGIGIFIWTMAAGPATVAAAAEVDLAVEVSAPAHVTAGSTVVANVAYYNLGTESAPDVQLTVTLPAGTQFITATDRWGTPLPPATGDGSVLTWVFEGSICPQELDRCNGHVLISLQVDGDLAEGTVLTTTAAVTTTAAEVNLANNQASATSLVCAMAGSAKQVQPGPVMPGDVLTYTITISRAQQAGGAQWEWAHLTDTLPFSHQVRFLGWTGTVTGTAHEGNTLRWAGQVQAGQPLQLQYRLGVEGTVTPGTVISNVAYLGWQQQLMQLGPVTTVVTLPHGGLALGPGQGGEVHHRYGLTLTVPPGAISDTTRFQIGPLFTVTPPSDPPAGLLFAYRAFEMNAYRFGEPVYQFNRPLTVTLALTPTQVPWLKQETLRLWTRAGEGEPWGMLGEPARVMSGSLVFTTTHFSQFALFGQSRYAAYLPLIRR